MALALCFYLSCKATGTYSKDGYTVQSGTKLCDRRTWGNFSGNVSWEDLRRFPYTDAKVVTKCTSLLSLFHSSWVLLRNGVILKDM